MAFESDSMSLEWCQPISRHPAAAGPEPVLAAQQDAEAHAVLAGVADIAGLLRRNAAAADAQGQLADASVAALRSRGLWRMRLCRELGGMDLPITAQITALAALAAEDTASAWCTMVANNAAGVLGATMPGAAVKRVFADGVPACTTVAGPGGVATPVEGGFALSGTWRLASGIHHADWIHATALVERDPSRVLAMAIPARDVTLLDTWTVVGLAGTGSNDFTLKEYFLPAELAGREDAPYRQVRGARRYDLVALEHVESYEHLAFALGIGRRALRELRLVLAAPAGRPVADREAVQARFGQLVIALQATEALADALYRRVDAEAIGEDQRWSQQDRHRPRALAVHATQLALDCVHMAFHRSGAAALRRPNIFEKLLRDMSVAATHALVDDAAFATYAQHVIETGGPLDLAERTGAPMAGGH